MNEGVEALTAVERVMLCVLIATMIISYTLKIVHLGWKIRKTIKETKIFEDKIRKHLGQSE